MGCRHLARVDFILSPDGVGYLLEANTMPGFTGQSLVPKAAAHAGISYSSLCEMLVGFALRDGA
jgi:D-alanine-D-alanine ligase